MYTRSNGERLYRSDSMKNTPSLHFELFALLIQPIYNDLILNGPEHALFNSTAASNDSHER